MAIPLGLGVVPLLWAILTISSILFCYFFAVAVGHLYPFVPSISSTGAKEPEGNVFAEAMNVSSSVCMLIMTFRYFQLSHKAGTFSSSLKRLNMFSLLSGVVSGLGITLVANFPSIVKDDTSLRVHDTGAVLAFVTASFYCISQTILTWRLYKQDIDDSFAWIYRFILTCVMSLSGSFFLISSLFAYQEFKENHNTEHNMLKWNPGDSGYHLHVTSNVCEWIGASSFVLFILSYFNEFQDVQIVMTCLERDDREAFQSLKLDEPDST